jgi:acylglycerol lipase
VYPLDLRGRGKSDGERFYVEDVADYVSDVAGTVALAKSRNPGLPVFLLGHSAGGVVSSVYVLDNQAELTGFICESFAFQVPAPGFALAAIKGLSHIAPRLPVLKLKNEDFSRDPKAVEALNNDPLTAHEGNRQSPSGHYHDLLNDLGKEKVMADINGWIDAHQAPAS